MIGIDIVKIDRISRLKARHGELFLKKFLSDDEITLAKNDATLAGFWAAKEAASKALGVGISKECGFLDIVLSKRDKGAPKIKFSPRIYINFNIKEASLSITHDGGFAVAAVMIV